MGIQGKKQASYVLDAISNKDDRDKQKTLAAGQQHWQQGSGNVTALQHSCSAPVTCVLTKIKEDMATAWKLEQGEKCDMSTSKQKVAGAWGGKW